MFGLSAFDRIIQQNRVCGSVILRIFCSAEVIHRCAQHHCIVGECNPAVHPGPQQTLRGLPRVARQRGGGEQRARTATGEESGAERTPARRRGRVESGPEPPEQRNRGIIGNHRQEVGGRGA